MKAEEFNKLLDDTFEKVQAILASKASEYADDKDRLRNFKQAAHLQEISTFKALRGMMVKHTVSIYDMLGDDRKFTIPEWDEKIIDHINYLILLRALVVDEITKECEHA